MGNVDFSFNVRRSGRNRLISFTKKPILKTVSPRKYSKAPNILDCLLSGLQSTRH
jgi:hypothetical protein